MSKKNTLEAKRQRKANKQYDSGYPNFYEQDNSKSDTMTMAKYLRMAFYSDVLNTLLLNTKESNDTQTN